MRSSKITNCWWTLEFSDNGLEVAITKGLPRAIITFLETNEKLENLNKVISGKVILKQIKLGLLSHT